MKKLIFLYSVLLITILISGCVVDSGGETVFRRQITIESNLSKFQIGQTNFDSTTVYPYVLEDMINTSLSTGNVIYPIYPVQDTGFIKFKIFGGKGNSNSNVNLSFKDSLTINTPIDTTLLFITNFSFN